MRYLLLATLSLSAPLGAFALTWDFDEGTTWGWTALEGWLGDDNRSSATTVYSEVEGGVWRIAPVPDGQRPALQLRSPPIGEDSALFDYVTLRFRIIHDRPTGGNLFMYWFNSEYRRFWEELGPVSQDEYQSKFRMGRYQIYPTEWENITIDIRALEAAAEANPEEEIIWQDTLFHFLFELNLSINSQGPADHPAFVEIDWIQLTGAEELLLGELQPRDIEMEAGLPSALFAAPSFFPLGEGIYMRPFLPQHSLGDVDGDGDVDLVTVWVRRLTDDGGVEVGWMVASNDGWGGFVPTREVLIEKSKQGWVSPVLAGGDFDGDGLLDLAFQGGALFELELWHNRGEDGFETILQLSDVSFVGLADGDGDGDVDLIVKEIDDAPSHVTLWFNDGTAGFVRSDRFVLDSEEKLRPLLLAGQPLGEAVGLLWIRPCYLPQGTWQLTRPWATSKEPPLFLEAVFNPCDLHLLTDLDGDRAVELIGPSVRDLQFGFTTYHGLTLWRVDASGVVERHTLLGSQVLLPHRTIASDLNGDGLLDLAVVDGNLATGPALVVLTGQHDGIPVVEGRYRLPGMGGPVLAGDVNGDGATDLVVLGRSVEGGDSGAFVFLNQGVPTTAIAVETAANPATFALGANYPNPFNPATIIPVSVAAGAGDVDLTIYNVLGQPVRQVWSGPLGAGEHRLAWDGRDGQGQLVAAGVYLVRLHQGDQIRLRKMVKLE